MYNVAINVSKHVSLHRDAKDTTLWILVIEYVHIHLTVDLETGRWSLYRDGVRLQGAIHNDVQGLFEGMSNMYLRVEGGVHYFDNLLIYTVNN